MFRFLLKNSDHTESNQALETALLSFCPWSSPSKMAWYGRSRWSLTTIQENITYMLGNMETDYQFWRVRTFSAVDVTPYKKVGELREGGGGKGWECSLGIFQNFQNCTKTFHICSDTLHFPKRFLVSIGGNRPIFDKNLGVRFIKLYE